MKKLIPITFIALASAFALYAQTTNSTPWSVTVTPPAQTVSVRPTSITVTPQYNGKLLTSVAWQWIIGTNTVYRTGTSRLTEEKMAEKLATKGIDFATLRAKIMEIVAEEAVAP